MVGITYGSLRVKNFRLFKSAAFDLNKRGLSVIFGSNKDANPGATNAAGKSSFFSLIPETVLNESSLVSKVDKITPGGGVYLDFTKGNDKWEIIRVNKGKDKIKIKKNGEDLEVRTKERAKEIIASIINRTPEEFFTLDYLDSRRPHPLHMGSTAQRRDFIIAMFKLENVDNLRKLFTAELRRIADDRSAYEEVKRHYRSLAEQVNGESEEQLEEQVAKLEKK